MDPAKCVLRRVVSARTVVVASLACAWLMVAAPGARGVDLVHRWSFDGDFTDSSGSGNDGIGSGSFVPGMFGQAVALVGNDAGLGDGVDSDFANNLPTAAAASWAMNVWVNLSEAPGSLEYVAGFGLRNGATGNDVSKARGMIAFSGPDNNNYYFWGDANDVASDVQYSADNQWHMYTMTYSAGTLNMYKDVTLVKAQAKALADAAPSVHVGNPSNWNNGFDGKLDEFAIFNDTLSIAQIGGLYIHNDINQPALLNPTLEVDRATGHIVLTNNSISAVGVLGYTIKSAAGALKPPFWSTVAGRFDAPPPGDGSVDPNDHWTVLTNTASPFGVELSEVVPPASDGGTIAIGKVIDFGSVWAKTPTEDISIDLLLNDGQGTILNLPATFIGGSAYALGDLNADGFVNIDDWKIFRMAPNASLAGETQAQAYLGGDLNGDLRKDIEDYNLFAVAYDKANGDGAFAALAAVPEPATWVLACFAGLALAFARRTRRTLGRAASPLLKTVPAIVFLATVVAIAGPARAAVNAYYKLNGDADEATGINTNLTLFGDATFGGSVSPGLGYSLLLDGNGDAAIGPDYTKITGNDMTIVAWVYAKDVANDWNSIVKNWGQGVGGQFHLGLGPTVADTLQDYIGNGTNVTDTSPLPVGEWLHVAAVADSAAQEHRLYINGAVVATAVYSGTLTPGAATGLGIGAKPNDDGSGPTTAAAAVGYWNGRIDEVGIYDTAMITAQIEQIRQNGLNGIQLDGTEAPNIHLIVDRGTGAVTLSNTSPGGVPLDAYQIGSASGSLLSANWNSLQDQNLAGFPAGNGNGNGWEQDASSGANQILEAYLLGDSTLANGSSISLGNLYKTGGGMEDLVFQYRAGFSAVIKGNVEYVGAPTLLGDVNFDGKVDIFDINLVSAHWNEGGPTGDANHDMIVNIFDINLISAHWGEMSPPGATAVPEPATGLLALIGLGSLAFVYRRVWR
jgi:trimeric autotransporter adhesin